MGAHVYDAARSHHDLQHGEIQRLLGLIQRKVSISTDIDKKKYNGTPLILTPRGHTEVSVISGWSEGSQMKKGRDDILTATNRLKTVLWL